MKIFIDTANLAEIKLAQSWGIIDGVTTNPTLISKENREFKELVLEICNVVNGPVSVEAVSTNAAELVEEAKKLAELHPNVVVKIPMTTEGLKAIKILSKDAVKTNCTLIFSVNQALLAAKAGATYASPFIGRLDDIGQHGMELVKDILTVYRNYNFSTQLIVASIRHPMHMVQAAILGAPIATAPFRVIEFMVKHPLTDIGIERFLKDWQKAKK